MRYCARCLYPANHPYGIVFDAEGVCSGCRVHEEKDELDWNARFKLLEAIVHANSARVARRGFDCVVPVTGGGDSYFTVHVVKEQLGLNPLLVHYNHEYNTRVGIRNLANLTTVFDCDLVESTSAPGVLKRITRQTLRSFGSMYWQCLAGYTTFPVQVAVKFRIPLVIWGVQPWSDQTGMYSHLDEAEMTERCRQEHALMGYAAEDLVDADVGVTRRDLQPFVYPYDHELEVVGVRGLYLSNYIRWDSKAQHERMIDLYGYESARQQRTFNTYEDVHCHHSAGLHDYLKFLKLGYSKVTDHASREVRLRRMTREEGIELVRQYTEVVPSDLGLFLDWVELDEHEFWKCVEDRRDPQLWTRGTDGAWALVDSVVHHADDPGVEAARLATTGPCNFRLTPTAEPGEPDDSYLLMGRGYIDKYNYGAVEDRGAVGGPTPRQRPGPAWGGER
jgi:N-acetyl sugar amidotransferase